MKNSNKSVLNESSEKGIFSENQTRREFFKTVSKIAIPTIAFLSLGRIGELIAKPDKWNQNPKSPNDCGSSCVGTCKDACTDTCKDACTDTCKDACTDTCKAGSKNSEKGIEYT